LREKLKNLSQGSEEARILGEGLRCVICGRTNVGKSTLFNYLLREERVIVSKTAGTTRDVIEETINIRGIPLRIYDTAGILEPRDLIDKKAIEKTEEAFSQADLVILVLDGSRPLGKEDIFLFKKLEKINASSGKNKKIIVVINKSDLKQKLSLKDISQIGDFKVKLSALKKKGIEVLEEAVFKTVYKKGINKEDIIFLERTQKTILEKVTENIFRASQFIESGYPLDFLNLSLKEALYDLGRLSGEVFCEEIIESIFSNFCIGK
jgi:tRNA modification GTPase